MMSVQEGNRPLIFLSKDLKDVTVVFKARRQDYLCKRSHEPSICYRFYSQSGHFETVWNQSEAWVAGCHCCLLNSTLACVKFEAQVLMIFHIFYTKVTDLWSMEVVCNIIIIIMNLTHLGMMLFTLQVWVTPTPHRQIIARVT